MGFSPHNQAQLDSKPEGAWGFNPTNNRPKEDRPLGPGLDADLDCLTQALRARLPDTRQPPAAREDAGRNEESPCVENPTL